MYKEDDIYVHSRTKFFFSFAFFMHVTQERNHPSSYNSVSIVCSTALYVYASELDC